MVSQYVNDPVLQFKNHDVSPVPNIDQILQDNVVDDPFIKGMFERVVQDSGNDIDSIVLGAVDATYDYMGKLEDPFEQKQTYISYYFEFCKSTCWIKVYHIKSCDWIIA